MAIKSNVLTIDKIFIFFNEKDSNKFININIIKAVLAKPEDLGDDLPK